MKFILLVLTVAQVLVVSSISYVFHIIFVGNGSVLALSLCFLIVIFFSIKKFETSQQLLLYLTIATFIAFLLTVFWVINFPPGGEYTSRSGETSTTWWQNGEYTPDGKARVWRVVGIGMAVFYFTELVRTIPTFLRLKFNN